MTDTLDTILSLARMVQATPEQLARAAALLNEASSTLRAEVTVVEATGRPAQDPYPPARRRILYGEPASEAPWEIPGFGPRRRVKFTAAQSAARRRASQPFIDRAPYGREASDQDPETAGAVGTLLLRRSRALSPDEVIEYMYLVFTHSRGPARDAWLRLLLAPRGGTR